MYINHQQHEHRQRHNNNNSNATRTTMMNLFKWLFGKSKDRKQQASTYKEKTVKILCMGKEGVGKTSVINKLCSKEEFSDQHQPTLYDDHLKQVIVDEYNVTMQFMDMGGSQNFPSMQRVFIQQADIYLLFYAVDDVESFNRMLEYRDKIVAIKGKHSTDLPLLIVRNKVDLKQKRLKKEVGRRKTINQWCGKVYDVSARTGIKINAIMDSLIEESKFIGNEKIVGNSKISGRYIYQGDDDGRKHLSASEVYHKAPTVFGEKDNSDEKMEKRRRRSLQNPSRKMSRTLGRSHSLHATRKHNRNALQTQLKETEKQPWMKVHEEKEKLQQSIDHSLVPSSSLSFERMSIERLSVDKTGSKESVATNKSSSSRGSNSKNSTEHLTVPSTTSWSEKKSLFKLNKKNSFDDSADSSPFMRPRSRKKSLSHTDIDLLGTRERSASMTMNKSPSLNLRILSSIRDRSTSVGTKNKPTKSDIVHTTLRVGESEEAVPFLAQRKYGRSTSAVSVTSRESRESFSLPKPYHKNSVTGRRLSTSIDCVSDTELETEVSPPQRLSSRRRSLSQNDLSASIQTFSNKFRRGVSAYEERKVLKKEKNNSLPAKITDMVSAAPGVTNRRTRSISFYRKKLSNQVAINEDIEEEQTPQTRRRKTSASATDIREITKRIKSTDGERPSSYDENKNNLSVKSKARPPLNKGTSFDGPSLF